MRVLNVVKHPVVEPARIKVPRDKLLELWDKNTQGEDLTEMSLHIMKGQAAQIKTLGKSEIVG